MPGRTSFSCATRLYELLHDQARRASRPATARQVLAPSLDEETMHCRGRSGSNTPSSARARHLHQHVLHQPGGHRRQRGREVALEDREEGFNCLARHGYNKRNFGPGSDGLANLLATLNLFAFGCMRSWNLWRQCRGRTEPGAPSSRKRVLTEYSRTGRPCSRRQATPAAGPAAGSGLRSP